MVSNLGKPLVDQLLDPPKDYLNHQRADPNAPGCFSAAVRLCELASLFWQSHRCEGFGEGSWIPSQLAPRRKRTNWIDIMCCVLKVHKIRVSNVLL